MANRRKASDLDLGIAELKAGKFHTYVSIEELDKSIKSASK